MTNEPDAVLMVAREPLRLRVWRWLGCGHSPSPVYDAWREDEGRPEWSAPGTLLTVTYLHVSFKDRLLLLLTGHAVVEAATRTSEPVNRAETLSRFAVIAPRSSTNGKELKDDERT